MNADTSTNREYDFVLILARPTTLTEEQVNALFDAGCDDATPSVCYGRVWLEFSRSAPSYREAVLTAIRDVRKAGIGAIVYQIDDCGLVTQAEIARKIGKSKQYVHQLITGKRGPGWFPPPECHLSEDTLLWRWCEVSYWLAKNDLVRSDLHSEAEINNAINQALIERPCPPEPSSLVESIRAELSTL